MTRRNDAAPGGLPPVTPEIAPKNEGGRFLLTRSGCPYLSVGRKKGVPGMITLGTPEIALYEALWASIFLCITRLFLEVQG